MDDHETEPLLFNAVTDSLQVTNVQVDIHRSYSRRWFMLGAVALLNLSNGMMWMSFSSIADSTASYYDVSPMSVNWLSIVFMITTVVLGPLAIWLLDTRGLRVNLLAGAWLNAIGAGGRILSASSAIPNSYHYPILLASQTLAGCAQPFVMFTPTKLAAQWFGEHQRTFANNIGSTANPIGIMLGSILSTAIVPNISMKLNIFTMLWTFAIPAFVGVAVTTFGVCSSVPPRPPSSSAAEMTEPFADGVKQLFRIRSYWVLAVCFGAGVAVLSTFITVLDQLLCVHQYTDSFVGLCTGLLFGVGLVGASVIAVIVDRTRQFELAAKVCFAISAAGLIAFMILSHYPHSEVLLGLLSAVIGFFGLALNPVCLELSVECSFPIAEGTSAGILILVGQIQAAVYTFLMTIGTNQNISQAEMCAGGDIIPLYAVTGFIVVTALFSVLFIALFRCDFRRQHMEEQMQAEFIIQQHTQQRSRSIVVS